MKTGHTRERSGGTAKRILNSCSASSLHCSCVVAAAMLRRSGFARPHELAVPDGVVAALAAILDRAQAAVRLQQQSELARLMQRREEHHDVEQAIFVG